MSEQTNAMGTVLVTGGASGLGAAVVQAVQQAGGPVLLVVDVVLAEQLRQAPLHCGRVRRRLGCGVAAQHRQHVDPVPRQQRDDRGGEDRAFRQQHLALLV